MARRLGEHLLNLFVGIEGIALVCCFFNCLCHRLFVRVVLAYGVQLTINNDDDKLLHALFSARKRLVSVDFVDEAADDHVGRRVVIGDVHAGAKDCENDKSNKTEINVTKDGFKLVAVLGSEVLHTLLPARKRLVLPETLKAAQFLFDFFKLPRKRFGVVAALKLDEFLC